MNCQIEQELIALRPTLDARLKELLPVASGIEKRIDHAMRYSAIGAGKALRPFLVLEGAKLSRADLGAALDVACAVEMVHTYSLIHDDLPAMDNDVLRRGKPTCHIEFDEATAILAGDGLLTQAFEVLSSPKLNLDPACKTDLIYRLAKAIGAKGMVGGQMLDLLGEEQDFDLETITRLQALKTGELIHYALWAGGRLGHLSVPQIEALDTYAYALGLLFQLTDDLLDKHGSTTDLGKTAHKDENAHKQTFLIYLSENEIHQKIQELGDKAIKALSIFGDRASSLQNLITFVQTRKK